MHIRRCASVWLEPRELAAFVLDDLLAGGTGVVSRLAWFAHAPHLLAAIEVNAEHALALGTLSAVDWLERSIVEQQLGPDTVATLLQAGLLVAQGNEEEGNDAAFRAVGWHSPAALAHMAGRWQGVDALSAMADADVDSNEGLLRNHGLPPPPAIASRDPRADIALPRVACDAFDDLLDTRATCRNFDPTAVLPLTTFSQLMARVFGARGVGQPAPGFTVYKRTSPSGGSLHPAECYLIVQRVEGVTPGLYRYVIGQHALEPIRPGVQMPQAEDSGTRPLREDDLAAPAWTQDALHTLAKIVLAGQTFFANAPVQCILTTRFHRNFWKYRNHAKAYRVCVLDVGHLSQTLQLCATQAGLGPFITSAINEVDIEQAFGLTGYAQGPLAICGFGPRAETLVTSEFDPRQRVWPR